MNTKLLVAVGVIAVFLMGTIVAVRIGHSQRLARTAFTAQQTETFYVYPRGDVGKTEQSTYFARADGSESTLRSRIAPDGRPIDQRVIFDLRGKNRVVVDGLTSSITTTHLADPLVQRMQNKPGPCSSQPNPEGSKILGYEVVKVHEEMALPNGEKSFSDTWFAPALDCYPLKNILGRSPAGKGSIVTNVRQVTSVISGDPGEDGFVIPSGYLERKPSEIFAEYSQKYSGQPDLNVSPALALDNIYSAGQPMGLPDK